MRIRLYASAVMAALLLISAAVVLAWIWMPGQSFEGDPPPLSADRMILPERLKQHVTALASEIGERNWLEYESLERARLYVEGTFRSLGYDVVRHEFRFDGKPFYNLEAVLAGTDEPQRSIVVGAHYDSVEGSPGANDNATGVAALLELAREFLPQPLPISIRFVAFPNEEPPFFNTQVGMGSIEYLRSVSDQTSNMVAMISLETIGLYSDAEGSQAYPPPIGLLYPKKGNFIAFVGNFRSRKILRTALRAFRERATVPSEGIAAPAIIPGLSWSDHRSFWQARVPAFMVTDTALFRDPEYHLATDTPERLDYERMARVVSGLVFSIEALVR